MRQDEKLTNYIIYSLGVIPIIWFSLLISPYINGGIVEIIKSFPVAMENPFNIVWCQNSLKVILIFLFIYIMGIGIYESTKRNYRRREEHGSAKWGYARTLNKKYKQQPEEANKILTKNVRLGLKGKKHKRNLNVLVVGRQSAQGKLLDIASQI